MAKTSKYAYDKHYYESLYKQTFNGNAVRKLDAEEEEALYDIDTYEEDYAQPSQHYEKYTETAVKSEPVVKTHRKIDINIVYTITMIAAVCVLLVSAFRMLETKSDITQTEKKIAIAKNELADVNALNESLKASLDTQLDRNYIYSVAVGKLGMVYPNNNKVIGYESAGSGHVRQLSLIH